MAELNEAPFGAVLAMGDQVFATAVCKIEEMSDPSLHAEMKVIRKLSEQTGKRDLSGFELYSTCEPCENCVKEIVGHGIKTIVYGCGIFELKKYMDGLQNINEDDGTESWNDVDRMNGFLKEECEALFRKFS